MAQIDFQPEADAVEFQPEQPANAPAIDFQPETPRFQFAPTDIYNPPGPTREDLMRSEQARLRAEPPAGGFLPSPAGAGRIVASTLMGTATDVASGLRHATQFALPPVVNDLYGKATAPVIDWMRQATENAQPSERDQAAAGGAVLKTVTDIGQYVVAPEKALPALIGAKAAGETTDALFKEYKEQGLSDEEAGAQALHRGLASGVAQAALWQFLPPQLKKIGDGLIDRAFNSIGPEAVKNLQLTGGQWFQKWLAGKVSQAGAGAVMGTTTTVAQNLATGQPALQGVPENAAGMALGFAAFPRGRTAGDIAKTKSDAFYREYAYWHDYYSANPNRSPGPDIPPISPQGAAFEAVRGTASPDTKQTPVEQQIGATINEPRAWTPPPAEAGIPPIIPPPIIPTTGTPNAPIPIQGADAQVSRPPQANVELQGMGSSDAQPEIPPAARTEEAPQPAAEVKRYPNTEVAKPDVVPLKSGDEAPVQFVSVQNGASHIGWYEPTRPFLSNDGGVYYPHTDGTVKISSSQITSAGFTIPPSELAKFKAAGGTERVKPVVPETVAPVDARLEMLQAKHDLTGQQAQFALQAFQSLPPDANPEALQKAYLKLALPSDMPAEVGLGKIAGIKGAREILSDLREASAGATALPVREPTAVGRNERTVPPSPQGEKGALETGAASTKSSLIESLLGKKPEQSVANAAARVKWDEDAKQLSKRTKEDFQKMLADKQSSAEKQSKLSALTSEIIPSLQKLAGDAGLKWRSALKAKAKGEGVPFPTALNMGRGDVVYYVARAMAEKRLRQPAVPETKPAVVETVVPPAAIKPADVTLSAGNVNTTSDVAAAQKAKPLGTGSTFDSKVAKEQKKFLLDAVDQAIAEAPAENPPVEADADAAIVNTVRHYAAGETADTFNQRRDELLSPLFSKHQVPHTVEAFEGTPSLEPGVKAVHGFPARDIPTDERVKLLDAAIQQARFQQLPHVTIEVPGDGTFEVINSKSALADFKERAAKFPTTAPRAGKASTPRSNPSTPGPVGKLDKATVLKALEPVTSTDPGRAILANVWSDGKQTVATNGRMLTRIELGVGGTEKKPVVMTIGGKLVTLGKDEKYPAWQQSVPLEYKETIKNLDIERTWMLLRQAMEATDEKETSVRLYLNKDRTIGISSKSDTVGSYETNVFADSNHFTSVNPEYLMDALVAARKVGDTKFDLSWNDELGPIGIRSEHAESVVMPMRLSSIPNSLGESSQPIKAGEATGAEGIKKLMAESGADARSKQAALAFIEMPGVKRLLKNLTVRFDPSEPDLKGAATVSQQLIEMFSRMTPDTFPHEGFHLLYEWLPADAKAAIERARQSALVEYYRDTAGYHGDNIPDYIRSGKMTSGQFRASGLPTDLYHLINPSEFLAHFGGEKFSKEAWEKRHDTPPGFWENLRNTIQMWWKELKAAWSQHFGGMPEAHTMESIFNDLLGGRWNPTKDSIAAFADRQSERELSLPLPRNLKEQAQERAFNARGAGERVIAGYADINGMQRKAAESVSATPKALEMVGLPEHELMVGLASTDARYTLLTLGNYDAIRAKIDPLDVGLKNVVAIDALRGIENLRRRVLRTREKLAPIEETVRSEIFQDKLDALDWKRIKRDSTAEARQTFINQAAQEYGDVLRASEEKGKTEQEIETLKEQLKVLDKITEHTEEISRRVDDIIATVGATEDGAALLAGVMDKTGTEIYRAYLDLKKSIAAQPEPRKGDILRDYDQQFLSEAEKPKLNRPVEPALTGDQKLFAQLASSVLAANSGLRWQLAAAEYANNHPEFKAQLTELGERFQKQFEADPNNAVKQIIKMSASLTKKELTAEAAYLRLHRRLMPVLEEYQVLKAADTINRLVENSPEYIALVNRINGDVGGMQIPGQFLPEAQSKSTNEFTGHQTLISPDGSAHELDLGFTKDSTGKAHETMVDFVNKVKGWLDDPANAQSPDRQYWQRQQEFVSAALDTDTALNPSVIEARLIKSPFTIPEYFFKQATLPAARYAFTASNNMARGWNIADQWYKGTVDHEIRQLRLAMDSHNPKRTLRQLLAMTGRKYDPDYDAKAYQRDVLSPLAEEYLDGHVLKAGDRLFNGIQITQDDLNALFSQGGQINQLHRKQTNLGREKVMSPGLVRDEWGDGLLTIRKSQELAGRAGATLPRKFSQHGFSLARQMDAIPAKSWDKIEALLNQPQWFDTFTAQFLDRRKADYSTLTPFEELYRQLAAKTRSGAPDRPRSIADIVDFIDANTSDEYSRAGIREQLLGEMEGIIRNVHKQFIESEATDTAVMGLRAEKDSSFTSGHGRDVGPSFFYDYGAVTAPEFRKIAIDSTNFHLVRLAKSLDAMIADYDRAIAQIEQGGRSKTKEFLRKGMERYRAGDDFVNWERLMAEREQANYFKSNFAPAYTSIHQAEIKLFGQIARYVGDVVSAKMSGFTSLINVLAGSPIKMALTTRGLRNFFWTSYPEALVNTAISMVKLGQAATDQVPKMQKRAFQALREIGGGRRVKRAAGAAFVDILNLFARDLFSSVKYMRQQNNYGMGFQDSVGDRILNILAMPRSHGQGYRVGEPKFGPIEWATKAFFKAVSATEVPIELFKAWYPQIAYTASYDAAARMAARSIDILASTARRRFEYLERSGQLERYHLDDPSNEVMLTAADVLPHSVFSLPKTQTELNMARNWFSRATDVSLNRTVLNYWRVLKATPKADRGKVSFLAADKHGQAPAAVTHSEDARGGALMAVFLKDVHHASPENRALFIRRNRLVQIMNPFLGWTSHSAIGVFNYLGKAPRDPTFSRNAFFLLGTISLMAYAALLVAAGETEGTIRYYANLLGLGKLLPHRSILEARKPLEFGKIAAIDAVSGIPMLRSEAEDALSNVAARRNSGGLSTLPLDTLEQHFKWLANAVRTGDPTYNLANLVRADLPYAAAFINRMESQKGLIAANNLGALARTYGDPNLLKPFDPSAVVPTPLSPIRQDLANAVYSGNVQGVRDEMQMFIAKAGTLGYTPEKTAAMFQQTLSSLNPYQRAFGEKLTDDQRTQFLSELPAFGRNQFATAEANWTAAMQAVGTGGATITKVAGTGGGGSGSTVGYPARGAGGAGAARISRSSAGYRRPALGRLRSIGRRSRVSGSIPRGQRSRRLIRLTSRLRPQRRNRLRSS